MAGRLHVCAHAHVSDFIYPSPTLSCCLPPPGHQTVSEDLNSPVGTRLANPGSNLVGGLGKLRPRMRAGRTTLLAEELQVSGLVSSIARPRFKSRFCDPTGPPTPSVWALVTPPICR